MKKYNFIFVCTFIVMLLFLAECLQKKVNPNPPVRIHIENKVRGTYFGVLYVYQKNDSMIISNTRGVNSLTLINADTNFEVEMPDTTWSKILHNAAKKENQPK